MPEKIRQHINVDELQPRISVHQLAQFYGFDLPAGFQDGGEQRMCCPCADCSGNEDERSVSINTSDHFKRWKCFRGQYGCGASGNLITLAYCMKHGQMPRNGKPTGKEFYAIAQDLLEITEGPQDRSSATGITRQEIRKKTGDVLKTTPNIPLSESENENARKLGQLDEQLIQSIESMSAPASAYCRRRPALQSAKLAQRCRFGYMPGNAKSTLRAQFVYGIMNETNEALAWVGRNVNYERDYDEWQLGGCQGREPNKYRFPKQELFRRGLELYGQEWITNRHFKPSLAQHGLIVCEGFNSRLRLHQLGVMAVAVMSNQITEDQVEKVIRLATDHAQRRIALMFDLDSKGNEGCKETLWKFQERGAHAHLQWSNRTHEGQFVGRDPETLTNDEWATIAATG